MPDDLSKIDELEDAGEAPADTRSKVEQIAALLRGDNPGAGDGDGEQAGEGNPAGDGAGDGKKPTPKTLIGLAETLGVDVADLYAVELRDGTEGTGKVRTLGELKDLAAKDTDYTARELAFAEQKVRDENEILRARNELQHIFASMPKGTIPKAVLERAASEVERVAKLEDGRTLAAIPEWKNPETRAKDEQGMSAFLQQYGFGPGDLGRMVDHRLRKMVRDSWQRSERVRIALEKVTQEKPKAPGKPAGRAPAPQSSRVKLGSSTSVKVAAISKLLREGK